eukprot:snap_masked-scaffold_89-processed-gene-0.27-mRNA-1 protein AED:1.00 eAED:1.00 QI:0/0/0/0/1/1/2/0/212
MNFLEEQNLLPLYPRIVERKTVLLDDYPSEFSSVTLERVQFSCPLGVQGLNEHKWKESAVALEAEYKQELKHWDKFELATRNDFDHVLKLVHHYVSRRNETKEVNLLELACKNDYRITKDIDNFLVDSTDPSFNVQLNNLLKNKSQKRKSARKLKARAKKLKTGDQKKIESNSAKSVKTGFIPLTQELSADARKAVARRNIANVLHEVKDVP